MMRRSSDMDSGKSSEPGVKQPKWRKSARSTLPISLRVTAQEKARLEQMAGPMSVAAYIRGRLFGDEAAAARPARHREKQRQPIPSHVEVARLLGMFGNSELATAMLALSLAAQAGELEASPEVEGRITRACEEIHDIRLLLIRMLGVKPQGG